MSKIIKTDFHVHTIYSDGMATLDYLVNKSIEYGFSVVSKADHNTSNGNKRLKSLAEKKGIIFIPSVEISTKDGHLVAINIDNWDRKKGGKSMQEQIEIILDLGGIPIIAHPYWRGGLGAKIFELKGALGYEMINHSSPFGSARLIKESNKYPKLYSKFAKYTGSDSHGCEAYGKMYNKITTDSINKEDILEALFKMKVKPFWPGLYQGLKLFFSDGAPNQLYQLRRIIDKKKPK